MNVQKSGVAHLLSQISLDYEALAQSLTGLSAGSTRHSFITARLEQIEAHHEQLTCAIAELSRYCKKRPSRVQYNIDVVRSTKKQQVFDAV